MQIDKNIVSIFCYTCISLPFLSLFLYLFWGLSLPILTRTPESLIRKGLWVISCSYLSY